MPIKCRKCGGPHNTFKCGKDKIYKIMIINMPIDLSYNNMKYLLEDWGDIGKININKKFNKSLSEVIIEFFNKEQAQYFKDQINNTKMNNMNLKVYLI